MVGQSARQYEDSEEDDSQTQARGGQRGTPKPGAPGHVPDSSPEGFFGAPPETERDRRVKETRDWLVQEYRDMPGAVADALAARVVAAVVGTRDVFVGEPLLLTTALRARARQEGDAWWEQQQAARRPAGR